VRDLASSGDHRDGARDLFGVHVALHELIDSLQPLRRHPNVLGLALVIDAVNDNVGAASATIIAKRARTEPQRGQARSENDTRPP
jgi:hypothetical protein